MQGFSAAQRGACNSIPSVQQSGSRVRSVRSRARHPRTRQRGTFLLAFVQAALLRSCTQALAYFTVTREWVTAWIESAMRFGTPTLRINLATWALTVRSSMPRAEPLSLLAL